MLLYTSSMDHYGAGVAPAYDNGQFDIGWDASEAVSGLTIIGDAIAASPVMGSTPVAFPNGNYGIGAPPFGARRGDYALYKEAVNVTRGGRVGNNPYTITGGEGFRLAIPGVSQNVRIFHIAFAVDNLPLLANNHGMICSFQDFNGGIRGYLGVNPSGRLILYDGSAWSSGQDSAGIVYEFPATLAVSSSPVIQAETWYSVGIKIDTTAGAGVADVDVYLGAIIPDNLVIDANAVQLTDTGNDEIDVLCLLPPSMAGNVNTADSEDTTTTWVRDVAVFDNTGAYNNDLVGQVFVAAQEMRAEDSGGGWTAHPRENIGTGICDHADASTGLRIGDNAALELGSADFTVEGFFRFDVLPATEEAVLIGKWSEDDNNRSYKLTWNASDDTLRWEISTDGSAVTTVFTYPFSPALQQWYHIAVVRDTAVLKVFVNGTQIGVDKADANTYHNGAAALGFASRWDSGNTLDTDQVMVGWLDEIRITPGIVRYTVDFTPTTEPFGRNSVDDTDFTSVAVLMGFDGSITDESSNAFTVTAGTGVEAEQPDDEGLKYEVLNQRPSWDDTYIEAKNTFASTILTLTAVPTATETVTLGSITYTFVASVSVANDVRIGADTEETLDNLIAAVNAGAGAGTDYGTGTTANTDVFAATLPDPQALFTATSIGTAGNSVASTETLANGSFSSGTTLDGGEDIPTPEDFAMERLPVDVTGVLGVQITARGYKSDAGSAQLRFDLVGPASAVDTGAAQSTDLNPSWMRQIFEEDPDTSATITPSTITGGRVRVTRTA